MDPDRLAYLRHAQADLQRRLRALNAEFARELRRLRDSVTMAHGLFAPEADLGEEQVRALVKEMLEQHPGGQEAARLLARIEDAERRLGAVEGELGEH
jgi:hypothetical protein